VLLRLRVVSLLGSVESDFLFWIPELIMMTEELGNWQVGATRMYNIHRFRSDRKVKSTMLSTNTFQLFTAHLSIESHFPSGKGSVLDSKVVDKDASRLYFCLLVRQFKMLRAFPI
jgi:hypothetical protein